MTDAMQDVIPLDSEEFFEHFGIKGMHWGVRNAASSHEISAKKRQRFEKRATRGEDTLRAANAFNSPSLAVGMKSVGLLMAAGSAALAIHSLKNPSPGTFKNIKMGMTAAGLLMTGVQGASIVRDIGDIHAYNKKQAQRVGQR